jgi:HK97 family phage major capsid protein
VSVIDIVRENFKARATIQGELRSIDEAATTDNRDYTDDEKTTITEKRSALEAIDERIQANLDIEVRSQQIDDGLDRFLGAIADREHSDLIDTRSIGQRYADSDEYRSWASAGAHGSYAVDMPGLDWRAVTDVTLGATSGGALTRPERISRIGQDFLDRRTFLIDLLPTIQVGQGVVEYVQDKTPLADIADKPAETAEGAAKPQAGPTFGVVDEPTPTIPVWANITRQTAADVPQVQGYLDTRLRYALKRRTDKQVINGNGSSPNLRGFLQRSGILTYAPGSAEARYISIRHAIRLMEDVESVPEIIVLNPADAELFDLTNSTSAGLHAVMDNDSPGGAAALAGSPSRTAWGLRQVHSTAIAAGTALLVDPMQVALFDRQQVTAYMTDSHASNFTSNILTLLLELRIGLGLFAPYGVLALTFNGTA